MEWVPIIEPYRFQTSCGIAFWAEDERPSGPMTGRMIRTEDPDIRIVFAPGQFRGDTWFIMVHHGTQIAFSRPDGSTALDGPILEELDASVPGLDFVIQGIAFDVPWMDQDRAKHRLALSRGFRSRDEQDQITRLFCELMSWSPNGLFNMRAGEIRSRANPPRPLVKSRVGFATPLADALAHGDYLL